MPTDSGPQSNSSSNQDNKTTKCFLSLGLDISSLPCLAVGGGSVGTRKAMILAEHGADVTVLSPEITTPLHEAVAQGRIKWIRNQYTSEAAQGFFLVVAATPDSALNLQIGRDAAARGALFCITSAFHP